MFIVAAHHQYKNLLQQFWGDNLVEVVNKAKAFCDPDNHIKITDHNTYLIVTWADAEKREVKIKMDANNFLANLKLTRFEVGVEDARNYLADLANLLTEISSVVSGYPSQFVIYDTDIPQIGLLGSSGGKVVHGKVVHK